MSDPTAVKRSLAPDAGCAREPALDPPEWGTAAVKVRRLPDGEFLQAAQLGGEGRYLRIDIPGRALASGTLVEIESGAMLYFGEVQQQSASVHSVLVEHRVDRAKLVAIRELWT